MTATGTLILIRHGQSQANADGLFTGLLDAPLTDLGRQEAQHAADLLTAAGTRPAAWFTSPLQRAVTTTDIISGQMSGPRARVERDWRLAERNYGALTGRLKVDVLTEYGQAQYLAWRRTVHGTPPAMTAPQFASLGNVPRWLKLTESLADVATRVRAFWRERLERTIRHGDAVAVVAHGNSLRALCMVLDDLDDDEVAALNIPTGQPLLYRFGSDRRPLVRGGEYLDPLTAAYAASVIASEGGT